jgi:hypothetical protein
MCDDTMVTSNDMSYGGYWHGRNYSSVFDMVVFIREIYLSIA